MYKSILAISFLMLSACTTVQPWEKDLLAKPSMALVPSEIDNALDEHIYFSKEARWVDKVLVVVAAAATKNQALY